LTAENGSEDAHQRHQGKENGNDQVDQALVLEEGDLDQRFRALMSQLLRGIFPALGFFTDLAQSDKIVFQSFFHLLLSFHGPEEGSFAGRCTFLRGKV
jgi:hypothetical protein